MATTFAMGQPSFNNVGNPLGIHTSPQFARDAEGGYSAEHANDEDYWRSVEKDLMANNGSAAGKDQLIKTVHQIPRFPRCSKAPELREWLLDVVTKIRTATHDPIMTAKWIREATTGSDLKKRHHVQRWFEFMAKPGEAFQRLDLMLLEHVKTAVKDAPHLHSEIVTKEAALRRQGIDMTGRQAIIMVRDYFRESPSDRKHTDRKRVDAVHLKGDDVEGLWNALQVALAECAPENIPDDEYLQHHLLTELRGSARFKHAINIWDMVLPPEQRTFMQLQRVITEFIKRVHEQQTAMQIRNNQIAGHPKQVNARTTDEKKGVCKFWKQHGACRDPDNCKFRHPASERGSPQQPPPQNNHPRPQRDSSKGPQRDGRAPQYPNGEKPWSSTNPKWVCQFYLKGKCKKSHTECPFVHNPTCINYGKGDCQRGDKCMFPHRNKKGALVLAQPAEAEVPADKPK